LETALAQSGKLATWFALLFGASFILICGFGLVVHMDDGVSGLLKFALVASLVRRGWNRRPAVRALAL